MVWTDPAPKLQLCWQWYSAWKPPRTQDSSMTSLRVTSSVDRGDKIPLSLCDYSISFLTNSSFRWGSSPASWSWRLGTLIWCCGTALFNLEALQIWTHKGCHEFCPAGAQEDMWTDEMDAGLLGHSLRSWAELVKGEAGWWNLTRLRNEVTATLLFLRLGWLTKLIP